MRLSLALASIASLFATVQAQTLVDIVVGTEFLSTLETAVIAADRVDTLSSDGPFTVFAPTDDAFGALPAGLLDRLVLPEWKVHLTNVIDYHVLAGAAVFSTQLTEGQIVPMFNGENVTISLDPVTVNGAPVSAPDINATNGVAHVIDQVLLPGFAATTVVDVAVAAELTLATLVEAAGLADVLGNPAGTFTVFAPTNEAFAALPEYLVEWLLSDEGLDTLSSILTYHVLDSVVPSELITEGDTVVTTVNTGNLTISLDMDGVMVTGDTNDATVGPTDILANNGIIHFIDAVLIPEGTVFPDPPTEAPAPADSAMSMSAVFGVAATLLAAFAL